MLKMWANPAAVARRIDRMRSLPPVGGSTVSRREFLTAKPTPYKRGSSGSFPFQKKVKFSSLRHPLEASLVSWRAAMLTSSLVSSLSIIAVFLLSLTCCRSSEIPGHMVRTLQLAKVLLSFSLFAWCSVSICLLCLNTKLQAPIEAGRCWRVSILLAGGCPA